jgi:hypothetical protein
MSDAKKWEEMTSEEKREERFKYFLDSSGMKFASSEAESRYKASQKRLADVYRVQEPDRVPVTVGTGLLPLYKNGLDYYTAIYEPDKVLQAAAKFDRENDLELDKSALIMTIPARVFDILDFRQYAYPGHGMPKSGLGFQFVEGEYMKADEYDALIRDPSDFWLRVFIPRIFGSLEPFTRLNPLTSLVEIPTAQLNILANPEMQAALLKLVEAGQELSRIMKISGTDPNQPAPGIMAKAPFDILGDTLRGTRGIMMDMYRQPNKLLEALDKIADLTISNFLNSPGSNTCLLANFPLHKGADGWMSQKQFDTFYWPSLKKVMDAFINEGLIVSLFAEGSFNTRLDSVNVFPKGTVHWMFDQTDMARAKKILGKNCSIEGNIPASLLCTGSPQEVKEYCRKLIEICAPGGGYILGAGTIPEFPRLENIRAMISAVKEYGVYR